MVLEKIKKANDIKKLQPEELDMLANEIREFLIESISKTGGHLASNLGVVELTMALHLVFSFPEDKVIWDVGHQSYTHKLLTGRKAGFADLRKYGGMSGFPKRKESDCDAFDTGHSSTSLSAGLGYVEARELLGEDYHVISVIGDGALTGGMSYEALNNASRLKSNFIMVLNDNHMSISENVGGISRYLNGLRTAKVYTGLKRGVEQALYKIPSGGEKIATSLRRTKNSIKQLLVPGMFFEDMGITYLGPVDGHDVRQLCQAFREAERIDHGVIIHVLTKKGKGYGPAEKYPARFHGTGPFCVETGEPILHSPKDSCTDIFSKVLYKEAADDPKIVAITAAMADGTGLSPFRKKYPERFFDVGIAEEHAVTFAAALAAAGMKPVFAVYSSFLQRAYDQLIHDVCLQHLHVVFAVDRAGLVGNDGETHQGLFDLSYLSQIPGMTVMAPKNKWELADMLRFALDYDGPIALRYPRGTAFDGLREYRQPIALGKSELIYEESEIVLFSEGHMMKTALRVREQIKQKGIPCSLVNARFIKPLDREMIDRMCGKHKILATIEENVLTGGYGDKVISYVNQRQYAIPVITCGIGDEYVEHGSIAELRKEVGLDPNALAEKIMAAYRKRNEQVQG